MASETLFALARILTQRRETRHCMVILYLPSPLSSLFFSLFFFSAREWRVTFHVQSAANKNLAGEIAAIQNCTSILTDPKGPYNLTAAESLLAFSQLSLYTNAESCPMCASAIRWAGFKEYIYGTSIDRLVGEGWAQIRISSMEVFRQSFDLASTTRLMGEVLTNETDPYFLWQYDPDYRCPSGCARRNGRCKAHS